MLRKYASEVIGNVEAMFSSDEFSSLLLFRKAFSAWQVDVIESQWNLLQERVEASKDFTELTRFHQEYVVFVNRVQFVFPHSHIIEIIKSNAIPPHSYMVGIGRFSLVSSLKNVLFVFCIFHGLYSRGDLMKSMWK